jgi:hypothetical protein
MRTQIPSKARPHGCMRANSETLSGPSHPRSAATHEPYNPATQAPTGGLILPRLLTRPDPMGAEAGPPHQAWERLQGRPDHAEHGIRANTICPASVETPMTAMTRRASLSTPPRSAAAAAPTRSPPASSS